MKTRLLIAITIAVAAFCGGWLGQGWRLKAEITRIEAEHAKAMRIALERALETEREGDAIALRVLELEAEAITRGREKDDEIRKLTSGRLCLSADVVRLLNDRGSASLPAPTGGAARTDVGVAADPDDGQWATDEDVAIWARFANDQYDACRARIDALRGFYSLKP